MTDLDYQRRFSKNQNIPEQNMILLQRILKLTWRISMTEKPWTEKYNLKLMDAETRQAFALQDYLRKLEMRIERLEKK